MPPGSWPAVVLVDVADSRVAFELSWLLSQAGVAVRTGSRAADAGGGAIDVAIVDDPSHISGLRLAAAPPGWTVPLIIVRSTAGPRERAALLRGGIDHVVDSTAPADEIAEVVLALLRRRRRP